MKTTKLLTGLLALAALLFSGCKKEMQNGQSAQASNVKFNITDAPANFDALNIDIQAIKVHSQTSGWVSLSSQLGAINILNYVNGSTAVAAQGQISAGAIDQVQLVLGNNNSVTVNGTTTALSASPALLTGLTVNVSGQLQAGGQYTFTIDFDASQSVTASGSGSFTFSPTIRLIVDSIALNASGSTTGSSGSGSGSVSAGGSLSASGGITGGSGSTGGSVVVNASTSGSVMGSISPAQLASVCITGSNGSSFCTMTNLSGQFTLQGVSSGNYSVTITPVLPLVSAQTVNNVSVTGGQVTNMGTVSL